MTLRIGRRPIRWLSLSAAVCCIFLVPIDGPAQSPRNRSLPRVGTIKDYPATGLMTGCGNLYVHQAGQAESDSTYVFLARADGSNAWMNLNGRDVRLKQLKSNARTRRGHAYLYKNVRISVVIEDLTSKSRSVEADPMFRMKITLRKGNAVRTVKAAGNADC
jgi:hypothetical protein